MVTAAEFPVVGRYLERVGSRPGEGGRHAAAGCTLQDGVTRTGQYPPSTVSHGRASPLFKWTRELPCASIHQN